MIWGPPPHPKWKVQQREGQSPYFNENHRKSSDSIRQRLVSYSNLTKWNWWNWTHNWSVTMSWTDHHYSWWSPFLCAKLISQRGWGAHVRRLHWQAIKGFFLELKEKAFFTGGEGFEFKKKATNLKIYGASSWVVVFSETCSFQTFVKKCVSSWWCWIFFIFTPILGEDSQFD